MAQEHLAQPQAPEPPTQGLVNLLKDMADEVQILASSTFDKARRILMGHKTANKVAGDQGEVVFGKGVELNDELLGQLPDKVYDDGARFKVPQAWAE